MIHPSSIPPAEDSQGLLYLTGRYLEHLRLRHFSPRSVYRRERELHRFRKYGEALGITQARQVTRGVILNYQSYLYHYRKEDGTPLAVGTQKQWLFCLSLFFSFLTKEGLVLYNPATDLDLPRKTYRLPKTVLSPEQVEIIMNVPDIGKPIGLRDRAILEVLYSTGLRRMELCRLDLGRIDAERQILHVTEGKGGKDRFVPIGERALSWLEKYLVEVRPQLCPAPNDAALFLNTEGRRLSEQRLGMIVHDILLEAGLGKLGGCHLFRHAFATHLLRNGCDLRHIQLMLGYASLETTQIYTHVNISQLIEAHQRFHPARMPDVAKPRACE